MAYFAPDKIGGQSYFAPDAPPTTSAAGMASPAGVTALASVGIVTASGAATVTLSGVTATVSVGQVTATGGANAMPAGVTAHATVGQVVASGDIVIPPLRPNPSRIYVPASRGRVYAGMRITGRT